MMNDKEQILGKLRHVFDRWDELVAGMSEEQVTAPQPSSDLTIKDEIAHLWAWQQRSVARSEAALHDREPDYPKWSERLGLDPDEDVDQTNAWIYETYRDNPWPSVHADWRAQFLRFMELSEKIPEKDLTAIGRYAWIGEWPLIASLEGSYEHHEEHLEKLLARLDQSGGAC